MSPPPIHRWVVKLGLERWWTGLVENGVPETTACLGFAATFHDIDGASNAAHRAGIAQFTLARMREYRR